MTTPARLRPFARIGAVVFTITLGFGPACVRGQPALNPEDTKIGLGMQAARAVLVAKAGQEVAYTKRYDLSGLPHYVPERQLSGTIRFWGNNYIGDSHLSRYWRLERDRYGIGYLCPRGERPKLRTLAVAKDDGGPYYENTLDNVQSLKYPLYCQNYFYVTVKPGTKMDPKVKEFVRYVLSQEGQFECERDGKYVPLTPEIVREQLKKLN